MISGRSSVKQLFSREASILLLISVYLCIVRIFGINRITGVEEVLPWFFLIFVTFLASKALHERDLKILLGLSVIEAAVVFIEFQKGIPSLFMNVTHNYQESGYLYASRPFGFGVNSSVVAFNLFMGFLLVYYLKFSGYIRFILSAILLAAIILTFNRTVLICVFFFIGLQMIEALKSGDRRVKMILLTSIIAFPVAIAIFYSFFDSLRQLVVLQFTLGKSEVGLSGREQIWAEAIDFIETHLLFGNNTFKWGVNIDGEIFHAHNSYLQIWATNGIIGLVFYLFFIFVGINRRNYLYVFPILLAGTAQYAFGWGISLVDILLFYFLFGLNKTIPLLNLQFVKSKPKSEIDTPAYYPSAKTFSFRSRFVQCPKRLAEQFQRFLPGHLPKKAWRIE